MDGDKDQDWEHNWKTETIVHASILRPGQIVPTEKTCENCDWKRWFEISYCERLNGRSLHESVLIALTRSVKIQKHPSPPFKKRFKLHVLTVYFHYWTRKWSSIVRNTRSSLCDLCEGSTNGFYYYGRGAISGTKTKTELINFLVTFGRDPDRDRMNHRLGRPRKTDHLKYGKTKLGIDEENWRTKTKSKRRNQFLKLPSLLVNLHGIVLNNCQFQKKRAERCVHGEEILKS